MEQFNAYVHARPDGRVFYVGKGTINRAKSVRRDQNQHHTNVVTKYGAKNILVGTIPCSSESISFDLEKGLIKCFRRMGVVLANATDGGEGASGAKWNKEQKLAKAKQTAEIVAKKKENGTYVPPRAKGWKMPAVTKEKLSIANKGKKTRGRLGMKNSPEHVEALRRANLGRKMSDEARESISRAQSGRKASEETKKKMSEAHKHIWAQRKLDKEQRA